MRKDLDINKHRKRFIGLATLIFTFVGIGHLVRIIYGLPITIGVWAVPMYLSWLALIIAALMAFMGLIYLRK